jgi:hypothetical protein
VFRTRRQHLMGENSYVLFIQCRVVGVDIAVSVICIYSIILNL